MRYFVYIVTNSYDSTLYIGVTNNLRRRIWEHREKLIEGFTKRYNLAKIVYFEEYHDVREAIAREKYLKGWKRDRKQVLVASKNPGWKDLWEDIQ